MANKLLSHISADVLGQDLALSVHDQVRADEDGRLVISGKPLGQFFRAVKVAERAGQGSQGCLELDVS